MLNLQHYGSPQPFTWTNTHLVKLLTGGSQPIVTDPFLINAFRKIDRGDFLPESHKELAYHDRLVKIGYGQVSTNPTLVAKKLQILTPKYGGKYLHLGTGTGYLAAILSYVAGEAGLVYSIERIQWLWDKARENVKKYSQKVQPQILYRDALGGLPQKAPYTGIIFSFIPDEYPKHLLDQLAVGGRIIFPTPNHELHVVDRLGNNEFDEHIIPGFNAYAFGKYVEGVS